MQQYDYDNNGNLLYEIKKIGGNNKNNKNEKNRWNYTTSLDKKNFSFTMLLISFAVLTELILIHKIPEYISNFILNIFETLFVYIPSEDMGYDTYSAYNSVEFEELVGIFTNTVSIFISFVSFLTASAIIIFFRRKVLTKTDMYTENRISFKFRLPENTWALLILGVAIVYLSGIVSAVFDSWLGLFGIEKIYYETFAFPKTMQGVIVYFAAIVIAPAFFEEFFCRFLILNLLSKYGNTFAIITSAVFFGFLHARTAAIFYATAIGIFSAYIAVKTKSIWFSIILHATINAFSMIWHYISEIPSLSDNAYELLNWLFFSSVFLFSFIYLIILIKKKTKKNFYVSKHRNHIYITKTRKTALFLNIAAIIFFCLAIYQAANEYSFSGFTDYVNPYNLIMNFRNL